MKTVTVRLSDETANLLNLVAFLEGTRRTTLARTLLEQALTTVAADPDVQDVLAGQRKRRRHLKAVP
jgi:predicted transcriptional regulator